MLNTQTNICELSVAFNENHLRQKRRQDITAENQPPPELTFCRRPRPPTLHPPEPLGTAAQHVTIITSVGAAELEVLSKVSRLAGQMQ